MRPLQKLRSLSWGILLLTALGGCSPAGTQPATDRAQPTPSGTVGPEGWEIGTDIDVIASRAVVLVAKQCLTVHADGVDRSFSTSELGDDITLTDLRLAADRYLVVGGADDVHAAVYDPSCARQFDMEGVAQPIDQQRAQALLAEGTVRDLPPVLAEFAHSKSFAQALADGETAFRFRSSYAAGGDRIPAQLWFTGRTLRGVRLSMGFYSEARVEGLLATLNAKYTLTAPSEAQFRDYNAGLVHCVSYATADGSVVLQVTRAGQASQLALYYLAPGTAGDDIRSCLPASMTSSDAGGRL